MPIKTINYHGQELFSQTYDIIFKGIVIGDNDYTLLADLLTHALKTEISADGIQINNAELPPENEANKTVRLDLKVTLADKSIVNIEMQVGDKKDMGKRTIFNLSKLMVGQVASGKKYKDINPVIAINILDFDFIKGNDSFHNRFRLKNVDGGAEMPDAKVFEIHFVELPKLPQDAAEDGFVAWLKFISAKTEEDLEMVKTQSPQIFGVALNRLVKLSADEELRERIRKAEKYEMDRLSDLDDMWEKARAERNVEVARSLIANGMQDNNLIANISQLSVNEIEQLRAEL